MSTYRHDRVALLLAATLLVALSGVRLHARGIPAGLTIRVYDLAGVNGHQRSAALATAGGVLAEAGINADWRECVHTGKRAAACDPEAKSTSLLVRLVHGDAEVAPDSEATAAAGLAMGYAVIEPASGAGSLATVFLDRVQHAARAAGGDYPTLLGRAIAHEVGHLLLGTNQHAASGLMRAQWTQWEILRNRPEDWTFSWRDRDQLGLTGVRVGDSASR
jgi:hypothetical protein